MVELDEYQKKAAEYDEPFKLIVPAGPGAGRLPDRKVRRDSRYVQGRLLPVRQRPLQRCA